jgi:hypothetical protein
MRHCLDLVKVRADRILVLGELRAGLTSARVLSLVPVSVTSAPQGWDARAAIKD